MTEFVEWEWRQEDPADFSTLDAIEIHGVYALGELSGLVVKELLDTDGESETVWTYYSVYSLEREGFGGYESIDGFNSLEEAKAFGDASRNEIVSMIRDER